jgi:esterase/lipase superfamily enzyme
MELLACPNMKIRVIAHSLGNMVVLQALNIHKRGLYLC